MNVPVVFWIDGCPCQFGANMFIPSKVQRVTTYCDLRARKETTPSQNMELGFLGFFERASTFSSKPWPAIFVSQK